LNVVIAARAPSREREAGVPQDNTARRLADRANQKKIRTKSLNSLAGLRAFIERSLPIDL
jgi:hypothetical protein